MKRVIALILCISAMFCIPFFGGCESARDNYLTFLSVRMKGNGDGTITAVTQHEFSIGTAHLPVTLAIYTSDEIKASTDDMVKLSEKQTDNLKFFESMEITQEVGKTAYYVASITYTVNGEVKVLTSETICYDSNGNRK